MVIKAEELKKEIEKRFRKYEKNEIEISGRNYPVHIFEKDEDINLFEGFLFAEADKKAELSDLLNYRPPVSGYVGRIGIIIYRNEELIIKDFRATDKYIRKTIAKINDSFLKKLKKALEEPKSENISALFSRSDVIEEFYVLYKKCKEFLLKNVKGISEEGKREAFADDFMMQMLTLWYLQEKGFFNGDKRYFVTKFEELKQKRLFGGFNSYYEFLNHFFKSISGYSDQPYVEDESIGRCVVIGPAVFLNGDDNQLVSIPDKCFYREGITEKLVNLSPKRRKYISEKDVERFISEEKIEGIPLLNLFESRDWVDGDIDEYVLGSLYEKLMTEDARKKTGSYYTPEEITKYICRNTIEPYLVDRINKECKKDYRSIDEVINAGVKKELIMLFDLLKEIKILDPAVGSAHFLESAINVLVDIYRKLRDRAKEVGIEKLEILVADEDGKIKPLNLLEISEKEGLFEVYVKFFIILSRNIYGVDINPSALKVARARLFLTLARHFNVNAGVFIRFPNVHFNLREGNSLIGYVDVPRGRKETTQVTLDFNFEEHEIQYIQERIKVDDELKEYLPEIARSLRIEGDLVREVEEMNRILASKKIKWSEFEKVLKTKEKLIRVLVASLNSKYAVKLNKLLREITELFNRKLDVKFAEEHGIDLDKLRKLKHIPWERKMFHWVFEFPEVFLRKNPGFDVVIGNPPYIMEVRDNSDLFSVYKESPLGRKFYEQKMDIFYFFIERGLELLKIGGLFGYIVQEYWLTRAHAQKLRREVFSNSKPQEFILFKEFKVFKGAPGQHNMILILKNEKLDHDTTILIKILKNVLDDSTVYSSMGIGENNEVFDVFLESLDRLYDPQKDMVTLLGGLTEEIWDKIHEDVVYLSPKEIQQGIVTPQHFVTQKHIKKLGNYSLKVGEGIFVLSDKEFKSYEWTDNEIKILKPFYFAEELDKYFYPLENKYWLIYTNRAALKEIKEQPSRYPNITSHLDKFRDIITSDHKPYGLHRPRQPEWFESKNKIVGVRKTKYPKFAVVNVPFYTDQATVIIRPTFTMVKAHYLVSILNSSLGHWIFLKIKTQGNQLQIDKGVLTQFPLKIREDFSFIEILSKYIHFLKQYQNYFAKDDKHLQYIIDYFDNLIDCLVYELYLGEVIKIPIKPFVENKLKDIDLSESLLEEDRDEIEKTLNEIKEVFNALENDKKLNENLYLMKLHPWIKQIYTSLGG